MPKDLLESGAVKSLSGGRPFTDDEYILQIIDRVSDIMRKGHYLEVAAAACGVMTATMDSWVRVGEEEHRRLVAGEEPRPWCHTRYLLFQRVKEAQAHAEEEMLDIIRRCARGDGENAKPQWQAAAWILERSRPSRWGKRSEYYVSSGSIATPGPPSAKEAKMLFESIAKAKSTARIIKDHGLAPSPGKDKKALSEKRQKISNKALLESKMKKNGSP